MRAASLIMRLSILLHIVPYGKVERHTTGVVCSFRMIYSQYVQIHLTIVLKKKSTYKNNGGCRCFYFILPTVEGGTPAHFL